MKKTYFKVQLFSPSIFLAENLVLAAARSNSGYATLTLEGLRRLGEGLEKQFPMLMEAPVSLEVVNETSLHIDAKIKNDWEAIAIIEEIEVMDVLKESVNDLENVF